MEPQTDQTPKPLEVEYKDDQGQLRSARLNARIIGRRAKVEKPGGQRAPIQKEDLHPRSRGVSKVEKKESRAQTPEEFRDLGYGHDHLIIPPYNLRTLSRWWEESTELGQAIRSMVVNTVGFGWRLKEIPLPEEVRDQFAQEIEAEKFDLQARLRAVHPTASLTQLRERAIFDKHSTGNGYMELIESEQRELVGLAHVHSHSIRLARRDDKATPVEVPVVRPDKGFQVERRRMYHRFRRMAQVRSDRSLVWFKEAGDPRDLHVDSGEYGTREKPIPFDKRATALVHSCIYNPNSPYGVPVWVGNTLSLLGSREAEEINYTTLRSNAVPSMMVIVENGALTEGSIERLEEWVEEHIQGSQNYSTFLLIEGEALDEGAPNPGEFRIKVEPLKRLQQTDELFQDYDQNNRDKIRQAFRLPPIFVGRSDDYSRATADTSRDIADEQVFAPERQDEDYYMNRFVLPAWGAKYHMLRSNHPNITDDIELIRLMAIAERSGAMTPRRADRIVQDVFPDDIGPLPKEIDLDKPFSITFAEAQGGGGMGGNAAKPGGGNEATRAVVDGLMKFRTDVLEEIEKRVDELYDLEEEDL